MDRVKKGRLTFKGGASSSSKKIKKITKYEEQDVAPFEEEYTQWEIVSTKDQLQGPLVITPSDDRSNCISFTEHGSVVIKRLLNDEPSTVDDVILGQFIQNGIFGLKTAHGKYLGSDKFGALILFREALSPQEEWTPVIRDDGIGFLHSVYNKFLSVKKGEFRIDSDSMGFAETFIVRCQKNHNKGRDGGKRKTEQEVDINKIEEEQIRKFIGNKVTVKLSSNKELLKAKEEGRLHGELLEKRIKMKSDKFCY